jgi:hypothetical protein
MGFETTISAGERPKSYALDRAATGIGIEWYVMNIFYISAFVGCVVWFELPIARRGTEIIKFLRVISRWQEKQRFVPVASNCHSLPRRPADSVDNDHVANA